MWIQEFSSPGGTDGSAESLLVSVERYEKYERPSGPEINTSLAHAYSTYALKHLHTYVCMSLN